MTANIAQDALEGVGLVVRQRPHYGDEWAVYVAYNGTRINWFDTREAAVRFARDYSHWQGTGDVAVILPPKQADD